MILGINNLQDVIPVLLPELQYLEEELGRSDWFGVVTSGGVIRQISDSAQPLSSCLPEYLTGSAILSSITAQEPIPQWCQNEKHALVYIGMLENADDIKTDLWSLGYELQGKTDKELVYTLLNRYLDIEFSKLDAMKSTCSRLQGNFSIMALFAQPEERLIIGSRGYPLDIAVLSSRLIVGSNLRIMRRFFHSVITLEKGDPVVLSSSSI